MNTTQNTMQNTTQTITQTATATQRKTRVMFTAIVLMMITALIAILWLNAIQKTVENSPQDLVQVSQTTHTHGDSGEHTHEVAKLENAAELLPEGYDFVEFISEEKVQGFESAEQVLEEGADYAAIMVTSAGTMTIDLLEDAPNTINNFAFLALNHYFEDIVFHRVLEDFMAQTGDPTGTGTGGPGYKFDDEFTADQTHSEKGILSMANSGPNTNGSQFFITFVETAFLDGRHAVFGKVTDGLDVLDDIQRVDPSGRGNPEVVLMLDDTVADAKAEGFELAGADDLTIEEYITEALGAMSVFQQQFELDGFDAVHGRIGQDDAIGLWKPQGELDHIEAVYIIQKSE